ncbi:MAG: hypothetical protein OER90_11405 [Gemmatimonadota bacterium]|nr:hypothetical protein [Gemmatimonadota bacterium]
MSNLAHRSLQLLVGVAIVLGTATAAMAQVGHPPGSSPYRELRAKYMLSAVGGYSSGSGGKVEVGPAAGNLFGARLDVHLAGPGVVQLGLSRASLDRTLIDAGADSANRVVGMEKQSAVLADIGLYLVFTGEKTWHGIAPYFGASIGLALGGAVPADSLSGFTFGTKFLVGPQLGFRWHPSQRLFFRVEGRDLIWKLSYPEAFFQGDDPVLDPAFNKPSQWTHNPMLLVSVGFAIPR